MSSHTLSVLVHNKPGVLARIAGLFSRRGFNIESLTVGQTEKPELSRMTVVAEVEDPLVLEQIVKQLNKLIEVHKVLELDEASVLRQLVLVKVRSDIDNRSKIVDTVNLFRGKAVDVSHESLTIEATGSHEKIQALLAMLEPFGVLEIVTSGHVALGRGSRAMTDRTRSDIRRDKEQQG
ncbi:acetolactate synthase small subunit [Aestuariimicrobium soli]|uniref:acetolactate synthase small subunit n=1 Tax=Aestuariimicrobium soli TaxID=2035834 RepID=UPI003EBF3498